MSQHGCPERLSNRSKGFQDEGPSQSTMEVLVETLTGTAFEMTVLPTDTIFAIKSKIFRVEGIPVSQQHLLYNLVELDDASSLRALGIADGARLRLVLGMRGGPISTRRLPPPPSAEPWRDIERLLDTNRDSVEWGGSGCKVTVLVLRDGERVNLLRVADSRAPPHSAYSGACMSPRTLVDRAPGGASSGGAASGGAASGGTGSLHDNAVTMSKMLELRRRMESLSVQRTAHTHTNNDKVDIQKTRSEETLSVPSLLEERGGTYAAFSDDGFAPLYDGHYARLDYDCAFSSRYALLPPIGARAASDQSVRAAPDAPDRRDLQLADALQGSILVKGHTHADDAAILEECLDADDCHPRQDSPQLTAKNLAPIQAEYGPLLWAGAQSASSSSLHAERAGRTRRALPLSDALFSSSTSQLQDLQCALPALSRHRPRQHLHLSDERLDALDAAAPPPPARRARCGWCRKRLGAATLHRCRCGGQYCAPHRYAEVHGCRYDYRAPEPAPKLPRI